MEGVVQVTPPLRDQAGSYGPHPAAVAALIEYTRREWLPEDAFGEVDAREVLMPAHDPALGLDGSVCKREVIAMLRERAGAYQSTAHRALIGALVSDLEAEWSRVRRAACRNGRYRRSA